MVGGGIHSSSSWTSAPRSSFHRRRHATNRTVYARVQWLLVGLGLCGTLFFLLQVMIWWIPLPHSDQSFSNPTPTGHGGGAKNQRPKSSVAPSSEDGSFNGAPLTLRTNVPNPESHVHCVGDTYLHPEDEWMGRSCHFDFLCFNTTNQRFVMFQSKAEQLLRRFLEDGPHAPLMHISTTMHVAQKKPEKTNNKTRSENDPPFQSTTTRNVAIGGINLKWGAAGVDRLKWFPDVAQNVAQLSYYELPPNTVWTPFHSLNGANPGHLVWDDFLAIYNLLDLFDLVPKHMDHDDTDYQLLLLRYVLQDDPRGLWASCDWTLERTALCHRMIEKFVPLLVGVHAPYHWSTTQDFTFHPHHHPTIPQQSDLVCARHGVAGLGALTDHGFDKAHGWVMEDYEFTHNHGRGGLMRAFRNFAVQNLHLPPLKKNRQPHDPHRIVFSVNSSDIPARIVDFSTQIDLVQRHVPGSKVEAHVFQHLSLPEQIDIARQTSIFVTICGGGAVTGMFLPPGATVILFYHERGGVKAGKHGNVFTHTPALLDWDLFSAMSHVRVHWMPRVAMDSLSDQMAFVALIRRELQLLDLEGS